MRAELRQPVVVDADTSLLQRDVGHVEDRDPECRIEDLRLYAVEVLVLEALDRIPSAGPRGLVTMLHVLAEIATALAGGERRGNGERMNSGADEYVGGAVGLRIFDHAWRIVAIFFVQPLDPQAARLGHVRVG